MTPSRTAVKLGLGAWLLYLAFLAPSLATWDGGGMLNVAVSIVQKHDITVIPEFGIPGRGGKYYAIWYPLLSAVAVPFAAVGLFAAHHVHLPEQYVVAVAAIVLSTIIAAGNVAATYWLALRLGVKTRAAAYAGIVFGFCTMGFRYARTFYADPLLTLIVTLGIALALGEGHEYLLGACAALAILAKPPGILFGAVVLTHALLTKRTQRAVAAGGGLLAGGLLYAAYDFARFGNVFKAGQPNFWGLASAPLAFLGLLFSPSVGLFVCIPVVLLAIPLWRKGKMIWAMTLCFLLLYSAWGRWYASDWGPRLLMPMVPALIALSALTPRRRLWVVLALAGLVMQIPTIVGTPERYQAQVRADGHGQAYTAWNPMRSTTLGMWPSAWQQIREAQHEDVSSFASYRPHATTFAQARNFDIVPLWWWMLPLVHVPRILGVIVSFLLACAGLWLMRAAARESAYGSSIP